MLALTGAAAALGFLGVYPLLVDFFALYFLCRRSYYCLVCFGYWGLYGAGRSEVLSITARRADVAELKGSPQRFRCKAISWYP